MGNAGHESDGRWDVLAVFTRADEPSTPFSTAEIAEKLDRPVDETRRDLALLAEDGSISRRRLGTDVDVWWSPTGVADESSDGSHGRQFEAFVDAVEEYAIFSLDPTGRVRTWNEGARRIKGYEAEEVLGEHFSMFYADDEENDCPDSLLETARREGDVETTGIRRRADGSTFRANVVITAVRDDDGTLLGFTKVTRDLTERQEFQTQIRRERSLNERILETVPVSITVVSPDGTFQDANPRALERLGLDADSLGAVSAREMDLYDEDGERIPLEEQPWVEVAETADPVYDFQCQAELPDLGRRWLSINAAPLHRNDGDEPAVVFAVDDITHQKERERELRRERNRTEELLRTAPLAISVMDADGDTVLANERAQEVLGLTEQELIEGPEDVEEWTVYDADGSELDPAESPSARVLETGERVYDQELAIESPDGDRRWFAVNAAPVFGPDGDLEQVITAAEDVTALKRREHQLERQKSDLETELSEILGRVSDAFYALDDEWRFTHVNDRAEDLLQHDREELLGERFEDVFPSAVDSEAYDRFTEAMETTEMVTFEVWYDDLDIWVEISAYPSESGLSVYFQDVTERKERELELERYRTIVETVGDGIYTVDERGRFTMVNEPYTEMVGYSCEELVGSDVSLVVDESVVERTRDVEADLAVGERETVTVEADVRRADGETFPAEATFAVFSTDDGYERIGVVRDVTQRKAQERALMESERRYRTLAENFPNGAVALFDEGLVYQAAGGQLNDEMDIDPEEIVGSTVQDRYPEEIGEQVIPHFRNALKGEQITFEVDYLNRHLRATTLPVRNAADDIDGGMLVVQDITERVEYRTRLEETVERLEESNERLEQFAYAASHDMQEPLRMVSSYLQLLESRYADDLDADAREFIEFAVDGAQRMRQMIDDLLAFSRVDTQAQPMVPTEAGAVVDRVLEQLHLQIEEADATVEVGSLPTVRADPNQFEQVFQNLVSNALKYGADDGPHVEIDADRVGDDWRFRVADDGIGIDPADVDRIFDVFTRLHGADEYSGTGIGLALCRKVVERHGGDIWVESTPGEGSTFYFTVPSAEDDEK